MTDGNLFVSDEVFDCPNLGSVIEDGNRFFLGTGIDHLPTLRRSAAPEPADSPYADVGTDAAPAEPVHG